MTKNHLLGAKSARTTVAFGMTLSLRPTLPQHKLSHRGGNVQRVVGQIVQEVS
jgi:hypothetical protein